MKVNEAEKTSASLIDTVQRDVLKIDTEIPVSPGALLTALAYEGDLLWMKRNSSSAGGEMGLPAPLGIPLTDLETINTDRLTRSRKNIEKATQILQSISDFEATVLDSVLLQYRLSLEPNELKSLASDFELGGEFTPLNVLMALAPSREAGIELSRTFKLLQNNEQSSGRIRMAASVKDEINRAGIKYEEIDCVVGIPVVGYGNQTSIFDQTISCLDQIEIPQGSLVVFNVNLPADKEPDNTFIRVQEYVSQKRRAGLNFIAVQSFIDGEVMMGDVRSAIFDGFITTKNESCNYEEIVFVSTDDDNIYMPKDWLVTCKESVLNQKAVLVGPVSFGGVADNANENFPNFMLSENLRCVVAQYILELISEIDSQQLKSLQEMQWLIDVVYGGKAAGYIESVVLSTAGFTAERYLEVGGYPAQDEITKFTRLAVLNNLLKGGSTGLVPLSEAGVVLTDNRRQLVGYLEDGVSPVAAWKNPGTRFQANVVDPVRIGRNTTDDGVRQGIRGLGEPDLMLSQTFFYMGIGNSELAGSFLVGLGMNPQKFDIKVYSDGSLGFIFKVNSLQELYD